MNSIDIEMSKGPSSMTFGFECDATLVFSVFKSYNCIGLLPLLLFGLFISILSEYLMKFRFSILKKFIIKKNTNDSNLIDNSSNQSGVSLKSRFLVTLYFSSMGIISHIVMLVLMSVNFYVGLSLLFGSTIGFYFFALDKSILKDRVEDSYNVILNDN